MFEKSTADIARSHPTSTTNKREITPGKLRRTLYWLTQDWIHLHGSLPIPSALGGRSSNVREYGHPAEWASDQCRHIADLMWGWHDLAAEHYHQTRPAPIVRDGSRLRREQQVIVAAWRYLEPRLEDLLAAGEWVEFADLPVPWIRKWEWLVDDEAFAELFELHRVVRSRIGHSRPRSVLPLPCPNSDCGMLTLERSQGMRGQDFIVCGSCGYSVKDSHYRFLVTVMLDGLDTPTPSGSVANGQ